MKAAVFYGPERSPPLSVEDVPNPSEPEAHKLVVKIAACGVCHTDAGYLFHGVPTFKKPPLILGHEPSGTVESVGEDFENRFKKGERVLVPPVFTCGHCDACAIGKGNLCRNQIMIGNHVDGAYAEFLTVPAREVARLPSNIPLKEGSVISDAVSTPYHAVTHRARVQPGNSVVVIGCGGVGLGTVQMARAAGGEVIAVDIIPEKLELAAKLGAIETINAQEEDIIRKVRKLTGGGAEIVMEVIGNPVTIKQAFDCVRPGGRVCVVGYSPKPVELNAGRLMFREIELVGSLGCRPVDFPKVIKLVEQGMIDIEPLVTHRFPLEKINEAFATLKAGKGVRSIIEMD
ncbi:MAG: zinc-binding dehydrogenase [Candidatus Heimdallarchaeota archaeon]